MIIVNKIIAQVKHVLSLTERASTSSQTSLMENFDAKDNMQAPGHNKYFCDIYK